MGENSYKAWGIVHKICYTIFEDWGGPILHHILALPSQKPKFEFREGKNAKRKFLLAILLGMVKDILQKFER
jgi:hypothetical protein